MALLFLTLNVNDTLQHGFEKPWNRSRSGLRSLPRPLRPIAKINHRGSDWNECADGPGFAKPG
jgi:hypothetical protein